LLTDEHSDADIGHRTSKDCLSLVLFPRNGLMRPTCYRIGSNNIKEIEVYNVQTPNVYANFRKNRTVFQKLNGDIYRHVNMQRAVCY